MIKTMQRSILLLALSPFLFSCGGGDTGHDTPAADTVAVDTFRWEVDQFADVRVLRYQIPGWEQLSLGQKKLAYYLSMAGLAGRDIMWDQNYRHNLKVRRALETVIRSYPGERSGSEWDALMVYAKEVFFSNGIHHHYGMQKFVPGFQRAYFEQVLADSKASLPTEVIDILFDPARDARR